MEHRTSCPAGKTILLACLLVAIFEQPIGNSESGLVMRHSVRWCAGADGKPTAQPLQVQRDVVDGRTGEVLGRPELRFYALPEVPAAPADAPEDH